MSEQHWFRDVNENVHYRVTLFKHSTGRVMEEWYSSSGERWYLEPGMTRLTVLRDSILTPCDPVPGMLTKTFE